MGDEEDGLLERALFVQCCKLDPNEPPSNGHEYLLSVRSEAQKCPSVITADVNRRKLKTQTFYVIENEKPKISNSLIPSEDWQRMQCEEFDRIRTIVSRNRTSLKTEMCNDIKVPDDSASEEVWFKYCFGCGSPLPDNYPSLTQVLLLKQPALHELIGLFSDWLKNARIFFSNNTCIWIYALLSCLEIPILPDTCSSLRQIAIEAVNVRSKTEHSNDELLVRLNLIICFVGRYFRQTDLADN